MAETSPIALEKILTTPLPLFVIHSGSYLSPLTILEQRFLGAYQAVCPLLFSNILIHSPSSSTVWIYLFFLPFQLVDQFKWYTIPGVAVAAFIYLGFLAAGEEIEQPFGEYFMISSFSFSF